MAKNGVIGKDNALPWRLPEDLKRFKALTLGHHIVMGRRTYESIGRPLPGRSTVIVTRNPDYAAPGCLCAASLAQALELCGKDPEIFVIGGAEIYRAALPLAGRLYLTELAQDFDGDAYFPEFDRGAWRERSREAGAATAGAPAYDFVVYERQG